MRIQISFGKDADLVIVRKQLEEVAEQYKGEDNHFYTGFMPRAIVVEKGFSTEIVDLLDEVLGNRLM